MGRPTDVEVRFTWRRLNSSVGEAAEAACRAKDVLYSDARTAASADAMAFTFVFNDKEITVTRPMRAVHIVEAYFTSDRPA
ncbi:MAG: hypothetical protein NVSMB19_26630 [Vulcanimicrobiaceae bacterium]